MEGRESRCKFGTSNILAGPYLGGKEGERERYIHVPIHEYTKLLLINHSYIQSISFSRVSSFS